MRTAFLTPNTEAYELMLLTRVLPERMVALDEQVPGVAVEAYEELGEDRLLSLVTEMLAEHGLALHPRRHELFDHDSAEPASPATLGQFDQQLLRRTRSLLHAARVADPAPF